MILSAVVLVLHLFLRRKDRCEGRSNRFCFVATFETPDQCLKVPIHEATDDGFDVQKFFPRSRIVFCSAWDADIFFLFQLFKRKKRAFSHVKKLGCVLSSRDRVLGNAKDQRTLRSAGCVREARCRPNSRRNLSLRQILQ